MDPDGGEGESEARCKHVEMNELNEGEGQSWWLSHFIPLSLDGEINAVATSG
jgi:hypothetical protein